MLNLIKEQKSQKIDAKVTRSGKVLYVYLPFDYTDHRYVPSIEGGVLTLKKSSSGVKVNHQNQSIMSLITVASKYTKFENLGKSKQVEVVGYDDGASITIELPKFEYIKKSTTFSDDVDKNSLDHFKYISSEMKRLCKHYNAEMTLDDNGEIQVNVRIK